jgi:muconolactone D-isomerase
MLFHVTMTVRLPYEADAAKIRDLGEKEHARAAELQRQGKWIHLWRVVGQRQNVSLFEVESGAELHEIMESLPLRPFMDVVVTALCTHPGAIAA